MGEKWWVLTVHTRRNANSVVFGAEDDVLVVFVAEFAGEVAEADFVRVALDDGWKEARSGGLWRGDRGNGGVVGDGGCGVVVGVGGA